MKHRRETVPCGASTLSTSSQEHGTPSQLQWLNSKENIWVFLQSSSKIDHCLQMKLAPKASSWGFLHRTKWDRKHCRHAYSSLLHICKSSTHKIIAPGRRTLALYWKMIGLTEIKAIYAWKLTASCCAVKICRKLLPTWPVPNEVYQQLKEALATNCK